MRFSIAALFFVCMAFIFFILWAVFSFVLKEVYDALSPSAPAGALTTLDLLPIAFGVICAIFFVTALVFIFVLDSLADEPEMYWRNR